MSLQVWLPLTKDLRQQGLDNVSITTNTGATFVSNGKLGGCYSFDATNDWIQGAFDKTKYSGKPMSLACWFKSDKSDTSGAIIDLAADLCLGYTYNSSGIRFTGWRCYKNSSNNRVGSSCVTSTYYSVDDWHHIVDTFEGGIEKIYVDGILSQTFDHTNLYTYNWTPLLGSNYNLISIGKSTGDTNWIGGLVNDVRIYDHCLSPMEVKELAKGLVLHYPLDRQGWGQENILLNTGFQTRYTQSTGWDTTKNGTQLASSWGGYNSGVANQATVYHAHLKEFNGEWVYEYIKTASESWLGISQGGLQSKLTAGKTYTFSWEEYHVDGTNRVGTGLYYYKTGATSANFHLGIQQATEVTREIGKWQKYTYTFMAPSDADWSKGMTWYVYGHYNGNGTFYVRHIKLEEGSIATPWCPNSSDALATTMGLNSTTEYDCSGYCNNGTRTGTFTWTSDTPKYAVSTKITPNSNIQFTPMLAGAYSWTIAVWIKPAVANNDGKAWFSLEQNTYWQVTCYSNQLGIRDNSIGGTGTRKNYSFGTIAANTWVHLVATYDNGTLKLYNNGVLQNTNMVGGTYLNAMNNGRWGSAVQDGYYWDGQISDARLYATALSADDVKSLYQNSAYIDSSGNVYGAVHSEV